jgi:hypothetical protein
VGGRCGAKHAKLEPLESEHLASSLVGRPVAAPIELDLEREDAEQVAHVAAPNCLDALDEHLPSAGHAQTREAALVERRGRARVKAKAMPRLAIEIGSVELELLQSHRPLFSGLLGEAVTCR